MQNPAPQSPVETTSSTSRDGREGEKLTGAYQGDWDNYERRTKMSSGVAFKPHPRYWLIGGKWYDLEPFVDKHPGGRKMPPGCARPVRRLHLCIRGASRELHPGESSAEEVSGGGV